MELETQLEIGIPHNEQEQQNLDALAEYLNAIYFAN